jgi:phosphatidate cytidylyltransferase
MVRILSAAVMLPLLWATVKVAPAPVFCVVALAAIAVACWECLRMLETDGGRPFKWIGLIAGLAVAWSFLDAPPRFGPELPLVSLGVITMILAMWRRSNAKEMLRSSMHTVFPIAFVGLGLAFTVGLRSMPGEDGEDLLMLLFLCVIFADTAAFYIGTWIGKRRMAPVLSPKKSWEGALAGMAASVLAALIAQAWFYRRLPLGHALILGVTLGIAAVLGDLAESMIKRAVGVKDASRLVPGHGGLLDRTDSLLFAGPWLYHYYAWFLQGVT